MTEYNNLNVKLPNSQVNKLKSVIKNETEVVLRLLSNMVGNSDDKTNFLHKLLLTNRQVANLHKAFANNSSFNIKLSTNQLSKIIQSGGFLGKLLGPLLKTRLLLMKNMIKQLAKVVSISLDLALPNNTTTLIISNDEMEDMKICKSLEDSGVLLKGFKETIQSEVKEQKGGFLSMLLGTLGASLLGDMLTGKGCIRAIC